MCFYHDYDWYAGVSEEDEGPAPESVRCNECRKMIPAGEYRLHIFQQEHEDCQEAHVLNDEHDCVRDEADCQFGESFHYDCCRTCKTLRDAIVAVEKAEGCTGDSVQPSLGDMHDDVQQGEGWEHYREKFKALGLTEALAIAPGSDDDDDQ